MSNVHNPAPHLSTSPNPIDNKELKGLLAIWVACSVNVNVFSALKANQHGEVAAVQAATGLPGPQIIALITAATTNDTPVLRNTIFQNTATAFSGYIAPSYPPPANACSTLAEVLAALYS